MTPKPRFVATLWLLLLCACNSAALEPIPNARYRILFIGNSLTYYNDLPATLARMALQSDDTMYVAAVVAPDLALIDHVHGATNAIDVIRRYRWDYVVLQQGPSSIGVNRDTLILATKLLDPHIRGAGARTALYMVWPSSDRATFFPAVRDSYRLAAEAVDGVFLPAGEAWQAAWALDPDLPLYGADGFHPSRLGTYLAALVMYEVFTGRDARALPATAVVDGVTLNTPAATIRLLQQAAHETNAAFAARPLR